MRDLLTRLSDVTERAFWLVPMLMTAAGVAGGVFVPMLDTTIPWTFVAQPESARAILATIATVTVSVAGVTFSIVVVALVLGSSQLSPRVMRTFRAMKLNQLVLGTFVATFAYTLLVLRTVGTGGDDTYVPDVSVLVAMVLAVVAFGLFVAFIGQIVHALEASTVIQRIAVDGEPSIDAPYPDGCGAAPPDAAAAAERAERRMADAAVEVRSRRAGYVRSIDAAAIIEAAAHADALVAQAVRIGDFVLGGDVLARVWCESDDADALDASVRCAFALGTERTPFDDVGFSIRQLADIALRGVSPSTNDPTTAENAMNSLGNALVAIAGRERPALVRVDGAGVERFVAVAPDLDALVRLGFDQVRVKGSAYPVLSVRLLELLHAIDAAAPGGSAECRRQAALTVRGVAAAEVLDEDASRVADAYRRLFAEGGTADGGGDPPGARGARAPHA